MRLFAALELSSEVQQLIGRGQRILSSQGRRGRYPPLENCHLTLKFLGDLPSGTEGVRLEEVKEMMGRLCSREAGFSAAAGGWGRFRGRGRKGDLIWLGFREGGSSLEGMAGRLDEGFSTLGWERERRPFRPHVTAVRDWSGPLDWPALRSRLPDDTVWMDVSRVVLFESRFSRQGMQYLPLAVFPLTGSSSGRGSQD